ncbi:hypothetical protein NSIN_10192 [Nitrosotalea sinensis]|uniref:Uncharacterized protein n=1 Tax=Nitrosotalea sinensis TaxID=1499975 RepID=A0A2H1EF76_9ARCH|nr:hypothetical protein NSIN_10192 [Candidatus Nitrosotalea sinensis]
MENMTGTCEIKYHQVFAYKYEKNDLNILKFITGLRISEFDYRFLMAI